MLTGHASHQIGLDADIWLTRCRTAASRAEREQMSATDMVRPDRLDIDPNVWTSQHTALIRAVSREPEVARIFVNAAIKKALCREAGDRAWLTKVRPMFGHNYHFHIRLACPQADEGAPTKIRRPSATVVGRSWTNGSQRRCCAKPGPPRPPMTMAQLPPECRKVLVAR